MAFERVGKLPLTVPASAPTLLLPLSHLSLHELSMSAPEYGSIINNTMRLCTKTTIQRLTLCNTLAGRLASPDLKPSLTWLAWISTIRLRALRRRRLCALDDGYSGVASEHSGQGAAG